MALGAFVGALAAANPPLLVLVAAVFAYAAGIVARSATGSPSPRCSGPARC